MKKINKSSNFQNFAGFGTGIESRTVFADLAQTSTTMATRESSSSPLLIALILVLTFPFWIAIGGAIFGLVMGLFGVVIGIIAAVFGAIISLIVLPFKLIFGWGDWHGHWFPHVNGFWLAVIIIAAAMVVRGRKTA
jgi:hypothetical protein